MTIHIAPHILREYRRVQHSLVSLGAVAQPWALVAPGSAAPRGDIIVFPGSFNPPTLAHVAMLRQARRVASRRGGGRWQVYAALSQRVGGKRGGGGKIPLGQVVPLDRVPQREVR